MKMSTFTIHVTGIKRSKYTYVRGALASKLKDQDLIHTNVIGYSQMFSLQITGMIKTAECTDVVRSYSYRYGQKENGQIYIYSSLSSSTASTWSLTSDPG